MKKLIRYQTPFLSHDFICLPGGLSWLFFFAGKRCIKYMFKFKQKYFLLSHSLVRWISNIRNFNEVWNEGKKEICPWWEETERAEGIKEGKERWKGLKRTSKTIWRKSWGGWNLHHEFAYYEVKVSTIVFIILACPMTWSHNKNYCFYKILCS